MASQSTLDQPPACSTKYQHTHPSNITSYPPIAPLGDMKVFSISNTDLVLYYLPSTDATLSAQIACST